MAGMPLSCVISYKLWHIHIMSLHKYILEFCIIFQRQNNVRSGLWTLILIISFCVWVLNSLNKNWLKVSSFVPLWCIIEHCCFPKMKRSHFGGGRTFWYHVLHRCCYSLTASKTIAGKSKRHWLDPSNQRRATDSCADLMRGSPSETICFCPCTVKTRSLGWGTPCWTSQLLWTKISLTSESRELLLFSGMLHTAVMPPWNTLPRLFSPLRFGLKPNDQILAEDKHKPLWVQTAAPCDTTR